MDEAGATRRAALGAVRDVEPAGLHDRIEQWLDRGSMVPGVLTTRVARAVTNAAGPPEDGLSDPISERAAGVQLIYDGLRLTRKLAHEEPWDHGASDEGDLDILVADVLVARGFYLLAKTEAAGRAVETVRAFGRDQTVRRETSDEALDRNLETDSLELAVVAGASLGDSGPTVGLHQFTSELVGECSLNGDFPDATAFLDGLDDEQLQVLTADSASGDGLRTSVDD